MNQVSYAQNVKDALLALQTGSRLPAGDLLAWGYYDTATLAAADMVHTLFQNPTGSSAANTLSKTNMTAAGVMPNAQHLKVECIKLIATAPAAMTDEAVVAWNTFLNNTTMVVWTPGKDSILQMTLVEAFGAPMNALVQPTPAGDNVSSPWSIYNGKVKLRMPIILAAQQTFNVKFYLDTAGSALLDGIKIKCVLSGLLARLA